MVRRQLRTVVSTRAAAAGCAVLDFRHRIRLLRSCITECRGPSPQLARRVSGRVLSSPRQRQRHSVARTGAASPGSHRSRRLRLHAEGGRADGRTLCRRQSGVQMAHRPPASSAGSACAHALAPSPRSKPAPKLPSWAHRLVDGAQENKVLATVFVPQGKLTLGKADRSLR